MPVSKDDLQKILNPLVFIHYTKGHKFTGIIKGIYDTFFIFEVNNSGEEMVVKYTHIDKIELLNEEQNID